MDGPDDPYRRPRQLVAEACERYGSEPVALWCADLLGRNVAFDDPDEPSLSWIGGAHALYELRVGRLVERAQDHWPRVWAARALLYTWAAEAVPAVCGGLADEAWRVREMSAKVIRHREIGEAADVLIPVSADPIPRVRAAVVRALGRVGEADGADAIHACLDDNNATVRRQARIAMDELRLRLDRIL